jgi:hypothetical protein
MCGDSCAFPVIYARSTTRFGTMRMLVAKFEKFGEVFMIS